MQSGEQKIDISWHYRQKIDNTIKTQHVFERQPNRKYPADVFQSKENGNDPFDNSQFFPVSELNFSYAFEHDSRNADQNKKKQDQVEKLSGWRIGFINNLMELLA